MEIHFIGIGGIGVSALAKYHLAKGYKVSGCDLVRSEITDQLKKMGVKIRIGPPQKSCLISDIKHRLKSSATIPKTPVKQVIYSPAVLQNNLELAEARKNGIPAFSYPQALGELTKTHYTIAVSGTHGKSTTTAMIGLLLIRAGFDPTVIVGTKLKEFGDSNCRVGKSKYLVIEADEHFASFLNYQPTMIVLTRVEEDHLDYYKTLSSIIKTFKNYVGLLPKNGILVANKDDKNILKIVKNNFNKSRTNTQRILQFFSLRQKEAKKLRKILKIPGEHNVANALATLTAARALGIPDKVSFASLSRYKGSWRRFEIFSIKKPKPYTLVSDYGHHPTEIKVTVEAARQKWPKKKIWLVYQPHQYARTYYLWKDFVKVLSKLPVDKLILTDIYDVAGREKKEIKKKVSSEKLAQKVGALYIPKIQQVEQYIRKNIEGGEILIVMGAGDIYTLTLHLTQSKIK